MRKYYVKPKHLTRIMTFLDVKYAQLMDMAGDLDSAVTDERNIIKMITEYLRKICA